MSRCAWSCGGKGTTDGKVEGWRPAEVVERRVARGDDPIEIGEARAELQRLA